LGPCSWKTPSRPASTSLWIDLGRPESTAPVPRHPFFDVSPEQIAALGDEDLRLLTAELCKADLRQRGLPTSAVLYGGNEIAPDGGIDVRVELPSDTQLGFLEGPRSAQMSQILQGSSLA